MNGFVNNMQQNVMQNNAQPTYDKYKLYNSREFEGITLGIFKMAIDSYIFGESEEKSNAAAYIKKDLLEKMKYILEKTDSRDAENYNAIL